MLATLPAVAAAGFDIVVAAPAIGPLAEVLSHRGIGHIPWLTHKDSGDRRPLEELRCGVATIIREVRPDLVHANSLSTARVAGPPAHDAGLPGIGHLRDIVKLSRQAIDDLNRLERLIAVSSATREFHVAQGIDHTRCVVIHNGVDLDRFQPRPATGNLHRELGLPREARLIATIGQLGIRKGTELALSAASQIATTVPSCHWLIVGERTSQKDESRDFEAGMRAIAAGPPLAGKVHFLGQRGEVAELMNECIMLVHAARQEPLGRVLLEAAASGLAVVATDVGGTREIFPSENDGAILLPAGGPRAIASAVVALLSDEHRREQLAAAAHRRAEQAFDIRIAAARLIAQYHELLM
jgi:glycosyltransferase involved in cell wall biosynthesis